MTVGEDFDELKSIIESLIFASPDPVSLKVIVKTIASEPPEHVEEALVSVCQEWKERSGGLQLVEVAGGYQIVTKPELHEWVRR
ncbi:MAG: SMC-Scp complex subunit ScpB, partial [Acidobacteriota bacterium]|nr:SMC-Scp complex subunit ScpB [Acidobacteriota bacterium]